MEWPPQIGPVLLDEATLQARVRDLGERITSDYRGKEPLLIAVLRGAALFHADLVRQVRLPLKVDFLAVASYGAGKTTSGRINLVKDLEAEIRDEHIILIEDIVDTGLTLTYLLDLLQSRHPGSLRVCSLLSKPSRREVDVEIDYLGTEIDDRFVVGYGLDYNQKYRNLPYIGVLDS